MYSKVNVACYLVCRWLVDQNPSLAFNPLIKKILEKCFPDWVEWKTQDTMVDVDRQSEELREQWKKEENQAIVKKAKEQFPNANVSLHDEDTGAVLIEHPPDGSIAQKLLGGDMEIRSPHLLDEKS